MRSLLGLALIAIVGTVLARAPGSLMAEPQAWTPSELSTGAYEATPSISADGREIVYMTANPDFTGWRLLMARCVGGRWTKPVPPPFAASAPVIEADPGYTPDGKGLYFISARHDPANEDFDIWYVARTGEGRWGTARRLPPPVNSPQAELLPRADLSGRLYFGSSRAGGFGASDIYVAEPSPTGEWQVRNLGPPVSTAANEYEAEVSRDGRTLIVVADRGDRSRLYRFELLDGQWRETGHVAADPNVFQVGPLLSPDARALLFAQATGSRSGEFFRADLQSGGSGAWPLPCGASKSGD